MIELEPWPTEESDEDKRKRELDEAIAGIRSAWRNLLVATDLDTFNYWNKELIRLEKILQGEKKRLYSDLHSVPEENAGTEESKKRAAIQNYQHEYYLKVTKKKRHERRKGV